MQVVEDYSWRTQFTFAGKWQSGSWCLQRIRWKIKKENSWFRWLKNIYKKELKITIMKKPIHQNKLVSIGSGNYFPHWTFNYNLIIHNCLFYLPPSCGYWLPYQMVISCKDFCQQHFINILDCFPWWSYDWSINVEEENVLL